MSITHTFIDFIPSIFLGAPDEETSLSVLPGHNFLLKGKGYEAIFLTVIGGIIGIIIILIFTPLFILFLPIVYSFFSKIMFIILILISFFLIILEKQKKLLAFAIFILAGFIGLITFNLPVNQSLLPLLTGFFGSSSLITSIIKKEKIPKQKTTKFNVLKNKINKKEIFNVAATSSIASPLCSFLPGLGSNQAAVIGSEVAGDVNEKQFIMMLGAIDVIVMGLSFVAFYSITKTRTGSAVAVSQLIQTLSFSNILIIIAAVIISGGLASIASLFIARIFAKNISKISYRKISYFILAFLTLIVILFSGFLGLLIFITTTFLGLFVVLSGIRRTHLMGVLILPAIIFYLPF
jgi:putative membrane protein